MEQFISTDVYISFPQNCHNMSTCLLDRTVLKRKLKASRTLCIRMDVTGKVCITATAVVEFLFTLLTLYKHMGCGRCEMWRNSSESGLLSVRFIVNVKIHSNIMFWEWVLIWLTAYVTESYKNCSKRTIIMMYFL